MIAADSSSLVAFFQGKSGPDVDLIAAALAADDLVLPPPVVAEFGSYPGRTADELDVVANATLLPLQPNFWFRAGQARRLILGKGLRARLADSLIAQCCIDADVALVTRDPDFRHFADFCGLKLA